MSGLCGIIHRDGRPVAAETLQAMTQAAAHRGPDSIATWRRGPVALAHLALHVTPEDAREDQPLVDTTAGLVLMADARIDNRDALQRQLRGELRMDGPTDADLILAAYRRWGTDCAEHLLGDFAFAVWDARAQRLFAARDPMAMRPLYYRAEQRRVLFGSEVKQILAAPGVRAAIHGPMVALHLCGRFDRLDWTYYEGIHQLEPAHALVAGADGTHRTWRYWDIDPEKRIRYADERDYVEHFRELFAEALRCRLRSTKPVGLFLSGGLDSGSIASMTGSLRENEGIGAPDFQTYSWAFPTLTQCDERHISDRICAYYDLPAVYINAEDAAPLADVGANTPDLDEPFIGVYHALLSKGLTEANRNGVGCMLTGHRADLLVGNWIFDYLNLFRSGRWVTLWKELNAHEERLNVPLRRTVRIYLYRPIRSSLWPEDRLRWVRKLLRRLWHAVRSSPESAAPYPRWVRPDFVHQVDASSPDPHMPEGLTGWARRERYKTVYIPMHMRTATWFERLCAQHQICFADPWTDRRLAEFVMAVPQRTLSRAGHNKRILRTAMDGIMPDEETRRSARKIDPSPLYHHALIDHANKVINRIVLSEHYVREMVDEEALRSYYRAYSNGQVQDHRFWYALTLGLWTNAQHG